MLLYRKIIGNGFLSLVIMLMMQSSADIIRGDANTTDVAIILSQNVSLARITPDKAEREENNERLSASDYLAWLRDERVKALLGLVEDKLFAEYARTTGVEPTESELSEYYKMKEISSAELLTMLTQKIAVARHELEKGNLSDAERNELLSRLRILETHSLVSPEKKTISGDKDKEIAQARLFMRNRNINRALFKQYGGRIQLNSIGYHEAIDAKRRLLEDSEKRGDFQILDKDIRQRVWQLLDSDVKGDIVEGLAANKAMSEQGQDRETTNRATWSSPENGK